MSSELADNRFVTIDLHGPKIQQRRTLLEAKEPETEDETSKVDDLNAQMSI